MRNIDTFSRETNPPDFLSMTVEIITRKSGSVSKDIQKMKKYLFEKIY